MCDFRLILADCITYKAIPISISQAFLALPQMTNQFSWDFLLNVVLLLSASGLRWAVKMPVNDHYSYT